METGFENTDQLYKLDFKIPTSYRNWIWKSPPVIKTRFENPDQL